MKKSSNVDAKKTKRLHRLFNGYKIQIAIIVAILLLGGGFVAIAKPFSPIEQQDTSTYTPKPTTKPRQNPDIADTDNNVETIIEQPTATTTPKPSTSTTNYDAERQKGIDDINKYYDAQQAALQAERSKQQAIDNANDIASLRQLYKTQYAADIAAEKSRHSQALSSISCNPYGGCPAGNRESQTHNSNMQYIEQNFANKCASIGGC